MLVPALLHRFGRARLEDDVTGCALGAREIDPHVDVFLAFGAEVALERGATTIRCAAPVRRQRPLARLRVGDDERELRPLRRPGAWRLVAGQRRVRAARAGVLRLPRPDGRAHRRRRHLGAAGRRQRRARRRRIHLRRRPSRGRDLPCPGRDQRRRGRRPQRRGGAVPAARPDLRQVRRRARASRRLQLGARQRRAQGPATADAAPDAEGRGCSLAVRPRRPAADLRRARGSVPKARPCSGTRSTKARSTGAASSPASAPTRPCATRTGWSSAAASRWSRRPSRAPTSSASRSPCSCSPRASRAARRS